MTYSPTWSNVTQQYTRQNSSTWRNSHKSIQFIYQKVFIRFSAYTEVIQYKINILEFSDGSPNARNENQKVADRSPARLSVLNHVRSGSARLLLAYGTLEWPKSRSYRFCTLVVRLWLTWACGHFQNLGTKFECSLKRRVARLSDHSSGLGKKHSDFLTLSHSKPNF